MFVARRGVRPLMQKGKRGMVFVDVGHSHPSTDAVTSVLGHGVFSNVTSK